MVLELLGEVIVSVTGMVNGAGRLGAGTCPEFPPEVADVTPELIVTWPVYVPGVNPAGSIRTVNVSGVWPLFGATNSHPCEPVLDATARKLRAEFPSVLVIEI